MKKGIKKRKKAFTIIELLITLAIIAVLTIIIVPSIIKYINRGKNEYNDKLKDNLVQIAKNYYSDNHGELPFGQMILNSNNQEASKYIATINIPTLKTNNYISSEITDSEKNNCDNSYVVVENINGNYVYHPCLICGDKNYSSDDNQYCKIDSELGSKPTCNVTYKNNYTQNSWTKDNVTLNISGEDIEGIVFFKIGDEILKSTYNSETKKYTSTYDVTKSGTYQVYVYDKDQHRETCKINLTDDEIKVNIDKEKPVCESFKEISRTKVEVTLEAIGSDKNSGINSISIDNSALPLTSTNDKYSVTSKTKSNGVHTATITDNAGNLTNCDNITLSGLDGEPPTIEYAVVKGKNTAKINATLKDNIGVVAYSVTEDENVPSSWTNITSTPQTSISFDKSEAKTYYIHVKDEADNLNYKTVTLKYITDSSCDCASWGTESYSYSCTEYVDSTCSYTYSCTQYRNETQSYSCSKSYSCLKTGPCTTKYQCCSCGPSATGGTGSGGPTTSCGCYCAYQSCSTYTSTCYYDSTCTKTVSVPYTTTCTGTKSCTVPVSSTCYGSTSVCNSRKACILTAN